MKKAVIYTRVSTDEQAQDNRYSLPTQERVCREYAKDNYKIVRVFEDAGKSATNMNRPALKEMIAIIEEDKSIEAILILDTDRIARNAIDHYAIKAILKKNNVKLISVSQLQVDDTAEGEMIEAVLAGMNMFQSRITGRKTKKGMEQKALSGWKPGHAPIGYKNIDHENGQKIIVIDKERAPFIKMAFEMYITGNYGAETINDILYDKGFRALNGGKLAVSKLYYILSNQFYYGLFKWAGEYYKGKYRPLITKETFDLTQKIRSIRVSRKDYERKYSFLLSGHVFCGCGRRLTAEHHIQGSKKYSYYHCTGGRHCDISKNIPCDDLERQVEEKFKEVQFSDEFYQELLLKIREYIGDYKEGNRKNILLLENKKQETEKKRVKLEALLLENVIDTEVYKRNNNKISEDLAVIDMEIGKLKQNKGVALDKFSEIADFARNVYKTYKEGNFEVKKKYLGFFWEKFIVQNKLIVSSKPTVLFETLQKLQTECSVIQKSCQSRSNVRHIRGVNPQTTGFISKNVGNKIINPLVWGG